VELTDRQQNLIRTIARLRRRGNVRSKELEGELRNSGKMEPKEAEKRMARSTLYECIAGLVDFKLVLREPLVTPTAHGPRKTQKYHYTLNEEKIKAIGYGDLLEDTDSHNTIPQFPT